MKINTHISDFLSKVKIDGNQKTNEPISVCVYLYIYCQFQLFSTTNVDEIDTAIQKDVNQHKIYSC